MSQRSQITITGGDPAVLAQIGQVASAGGASVVVVQPPGATCSVFSGLFPPDQLKPVRGLDGEICPVCQSSAVRLVDRFEDAARTHYREFKGQLPQMIRDLRGGATEPTFYQGFEG
ncbi:MAG TPA: hypothetical protein VF615_25700 [Longimicrobiaceae bacterium]|jgi:hypothetical protein